MKPSDFFTRPHANKGAKMELVDPLTGKPSGEYLTVLGLESDAFHSALTAKRKRSLEILALSPEEREAAEEDNDLTLFTALVTGWSFKEDFTEDALKSLLREAPQVKLAVDKFASNIANFITRPSKN